MYSSEELSPLDHEVSTVRVLGLPHMHSRIHVQVLYNVYGLIFVGLSFADREFLRFLRIMDFRNFCVCSFLPASATDVK